MPNQQQSVEATLAERGSRYGKFSDHARIAQDLQQVLHAYSVVKTLPGKECIIHPWQCLPPVHAQALTVICDKIARVMSGDCNYLDNWHDIQGYAKLVEDYIKQQGAERAEDVAESRASTEPSSKQAEPSFYSFGDSVLVSGSDLSNASWFPAKYIATHTFGPEGNKTVQHIVLLSGKTTPNSFSFCKFAAPQQEQEPVAPQESFKAGETVMVRDSDEQKWQYAVYVAHVGSSGCGYPHVAKAHGGLAPAGWKQCKRAD